MTGLLKNLRDRGGHSVAPHAEAVEEWTEHVAESAAPVLMAESSWFRGANIPGKPNKYLLYAGSLPKLRERLDEIADTEYPGFDFAHTA